jgi:hypothetical protein
MLQEEKNAGRRVVGYGATSKSTTSLNYCNIGPDLIEFISDTTPIKLGKYSPGMHIPVKSHAEFAENPAVQAGMQEIANMGGNAAINRLMVLAGGAALRAGGFNPVAANTLATLVLA